MSRIRTNNVKVSVSLDGFTFHTDFFDRSFYAHSMYDKKTRLDTAQ